jgi:hypothetical protein
VRVALGQGAAGDQQLAQVLDGERVPAGSPVLLGQPAAAWSSAWWVSASSPAASRSRIGTAGLRPSQPIAVSGLSTPMTACCSGTSAAGTVPSGPASSLVSLSWSWQRKQIGERSGVVRRQRVVIPQTEQGSMGAW